MPSVACVTASRSRIIRTFEPLLLSSLVEAKYKIFKEGSNSEGTFKRTKKQWCHFIGKSSFWCSVSDDKLAQMLHPFQALFCRICSKISGLQFRKSKYSKPTPTVACKIKWIPCRMSLASDPLLIEKTNICHQRVGNSLWFFQVHKAFLLSVVTCLQNPLFR